ncbi:amino acid transporters [Pelotomaculum thermopropionicum SI]|uniref:Amino acid transporters n=1 Tax=Pelotomaculum thermopropionicum (strain DSM 13744 / JCM 10971 / SI) TaxID=370438 RepID=A5D044_PELTS|nr:amino acid transporters [Pelotomaculum thermopropionicum SI]
MPGSLKRLLIGRPLHNNEIIKEKLPKWKALSIFSSDAISSIGYGPEQVVLILAVPWALAYGYTWLVAAAILLTLGFVTLSYAQVAQANPGGGGSYSVARNNLSELAALTAAAALFIDYSLTVAVSISSGTDAIISAFPMLLGHRLELNLFVLFGILMLINLRGVRESSNAFVFPTYAFIFGILALIAYGIFRMVTGHEVVIPQQSLARQPLDWAVLYLALRAFASGCSSMTGIEAISNGVPMFKEPEVRNAKITTYWMSTILAVMFAGITLLILHYHIMPAENVTVVSQVAELTFGRSFMYYYIQVTTMFVLYLAANTAYNGLPPLLSILARDKYMPRYLAARGDRLTFHNGIILLSIVAAVLIILYHGNTEHLISLYALGVFLSFTIAQCGMVVHWRKEKVPGWTVRAFLNGLGAAVTGIVVLVIMVAKFFYGAWLILVAIPSLIYIFKRIYNHYEDMREQLALPLDESITIKPAEGSNIIIVPVAGVTRVVANTLTYAKKLSDRIVAVYVATDEEAAKKIRGKWEKWNPGVRLIVLYSPHRAIIAPLFKFIDRVEKKKNPEDYITILIPEFETKKWWHRLLHNQTGWLLRTLLILRKNIVVTVVPYRLEK